MSRINFVGLALAVTFLMAASVRAEILRENVDDLKSLVRLLSYNGSEKPDLVEFGFFDADLTHNFVSLMSTSTWTLWGYSGTTGIYDGFVVEIGGGTLDEFLAATGTAVSGSTGDYLTISADDFMAMGSMVFAFERPLLTPPPFTFTVYGIKEPSSTPEPATLAVLGLGLAGLGLARRRAGK